MWVAPVRVDLLHELGLSQSKGEMAPYPENSHFPGDADRTRLPISESENWRYINLGVCTSYSCLSWVMAVGKDKIQYSEYR